MDKIIFKKNIGLIILLFSILITFLLINFRSVAIVSTENKKIPFIESKKLIPHTHQSIIKSQGFISSDANLTLVSELQSQVQWVSDKLKKGMSFSKNDTLLILNIMYKLVKETKKNKILFPKTRLDILKNIPPPK